MLHSEILDEPIRRLVADFQPERIILFCSQARDDADDRSDVDLLVVTYFTGRRRIYGIMCTSCPVQGSAGARDVLNK